jgi:DNA-binding NarL/FixJ family response regulator
MKIVLVDDHPVVRKGLRSILEDNGSYSVCGEAEDGNEAIKLLNKHKPDLVIVDIELKGNINGIELVSAVCQRYPKIISLVMSIDDGTLYAERAIKAGAKGYIAKEEASENIITAIEAVMDGKIYLSNEISNKIAVKHIYGSYNNDGNNGDIELLSNREFEIFELIGKGFKRSEIGKRLNLNINTIESHRRKIREKLNLSSSSELTRFAVCWHVEQSNKNK